MGGRFSSTKVALFLSLLKVLDVLLSLSLFATQIIIFGLRCNLNWLWLRGNSFLGFRLCDRLLFLFWLFYLEMSELSFNHGGLRLDCCNRRLRSKLDRLLSGGFLGRNGLNRLLIFHVPESPLTCLTLPSLFGSYGLEFLADSLLFLLSQSLLRLPLGLVLSLMLGLQLLDRETLLLSDVFQLRVLLLFLLVLLLELLAFLFKHKLLEQLLCLLLRLIAVARLIPLQDLHSLLVFEVCRNGENSLTLFVAR